MRQIYNKAALEKLSSPDQLDRMIVVSGRHMWVFLLAVAAVLGVVLFWAFFTTTPVNLEVEGVYMNTGGTEILYSQNNGLISEVLVKNGDEVKKGDTLAYIRMANEAGEVEKLDARIEALRAVTFESRNDLPSSDNSQLLEIKRSLMTLDQSMRASQASLELQEGLRDEAEKDVKKKKAALEKSQAAYYGSAQGEGQTVYIEYTQAQSDYSLAQSSAASLQSLYLQAQSAYEAALKNFESVYPAYEGGPKYSDDPKDPNYDAAYAAALSQVNAARSSAQAYQKEYDAAEKTANDAKARVDHYKSLYEDQQSREAARAGSNTVAYSEYNQALSDYVNAESKYQSLQGEVLAAEMQLELEREYLAEQTLSLNTQFENLKGALLDQIIKERQSYLDAMEKAVVEATADGIIYELSLTEGGAVQQGGRVGSILVGDTSANELICYVPLDQAKKLTPGMIVRAYPSIVNRQEYGHITGKIREVSDYPVSSEEMLAEMGSESLVAAFQQLGPAIVVRCELDKDESTASGYKWSSQKGKDVIIPSCTFMSASIEIEHKSPIDIIIPYIKERLSFEDHF